MSNKATIVNNIARIVYTLTPVVAKIDLSKERTAQRRGYLIMNKGTVINLLKGHYTGKIVDIDIYFNDYTKVQQATVIVINNHMVEQYIVDEMGYISFNTMITTGDSVTLKSTL